MKPSRSGLLLPWIFPAILGLVAFSVLLSGRDLSQLFMSLSVATEAPRPPLLAWVQRGVSLLLLLAAAGYVNQHFAQQRRVPSPLLLGAFLLYWLGTVASPALLGANPQVSHDLLYALAAGTACCLVDASDRERLMRAARDTLMVLMLAGLALIPLRLSMVLDLSYAQGVIPGLPRFGGLTPHPVTQGMLAQVALLLLWTQPYARPWLNRLAWTLGLAVLFVAQSKTAWTAFAACLGVMWVVRNGAAFWQRMVDPRGGGFGIVVCLGLIAAVLAFGSWMLLGDALGSVAGFADSREGAEFMTLTGRDRIWAAALDEWRQNPVFGYGLSLWDAAYRARIGMPQATHAHNQFLDDLARAGNVGATALVVYAAVLLWLALRCARASGGLSLALFLSVALRSVSEVPLSLLGYGTELFVQLLLLATLAGAASEQREAVLRRMPLRFGVASS
jgi:O-antigen ligase